MTGIIRHPSARDLRIFATLQVVFFGVIAWIMASRLVGGLWIGLVLGLSALVLVIGLARPGWIRLIYIGWMAAVFPLGWTISHLILALVYYLVFTPAGLILRVLGRDSMGRRPAPKTQSYWVSRDKSTSPERYFRQY